MRHREEKIAIIGGGLSGLTMMHLLKEKGYTNITLYEADSRLGGKLYSTTYNGRSYELGAIFGLPSQKHFKKWLKKLNIKTDGPKLSRMNYNAKGELAPQLPKEELMAFLDEIHRLPEVLKLYPSLKDVSLKHTETALMVPFSKWCDTHGFKVLKKIYMHYFTIFGLGPLDEVPAVYVHRILNYDHLMTFMEVPEFLTCQNGVETLVKALSKGASDIRMSQRVKSIRPYPSGQQLLITDYDAVTYDVVILATPLNAFKDLYLFDESIKKMISQVKYQDFAVHLWHVDQMPMGCGCILDNLVVERRGHVTLWVNRWGGLPKRELMTTYVYEYPETKRNRTVLNIQSDLEEFGIESPRLYHAVHWKHCPYFTQEQLESGFYSKIEALQGCDGIYFIGEFMSTLSMENVMRYAEYVANAYF